MNLALASSSLAKRGEELQSLRQQQAVRLGLPWLPAIEELQSATCPPLFRPGMTLRQVLAMEQSAAKTALDTLVEVVEPVGVVDVEASVGEDSVAKKAKMPPRKKKVSLTRTHQIRLLMYIADMGKRGWSVRRFCGCARSMTSPPQKSTTLMKRWLLLARFLTKVGVSKEVHLRTSHLKLGITVTVVLPMVGLGGAWAQMI
eukprot:4705692-Amphidinium_carterae.1